MARVTPRSSGVLSIRGSHPLDAPASPELYALHSRRRVGDAERGRGLFASLELGCQRCHKVQGAGGQLGPDLTGIGQKFGRDQLVEAVLFPSRQILNGYQQVILTTDDGESVTGLVQTEDAVSVTLADAGGKASVVRKDHIRARRMSDVSPMPEGLHNGLSLDAFSDLIAYLEQLRGQATSVR
jgi:quinoprotein glucose dehydrogenase